ncbi:zinc finger and BTB domain-containing protein 14 isoform X2 [Anabrus simplex]|uniref:zinc finger and BTB domain-containing protein 14 isoform X2 n=1 Tax=Anabrus simplex TaxID=316456 RepID=UPI0035A34688
MAEEQQFCLRWNNFQVNITSQFEALRDEEDFVDVTLACEGKRLKAHKVVLSACSPYFKDLFKSNPCKHPILFMRDVEFRHLQSLVEFMYAGEVNVAQAQLSSFLRTAESLQIRGLTEAPQRHKQMDGNVQGTTSSSHHTASSPGDNSRANASSPEEEGDDDDVLSLSPPSTPPPAKRQCRDQDDASHGPSVHTNQGDSVKNEVPDMVEPKVEAPDYSSDGESKQDGGAMSASFMGLDNSVDMNTSFTGLHADQRKLHSLDPRPCPICYRMYSNLSNLRQHLRLIHNPQTVACPLCSKPFKTKLYLKRHLMSFHELLCTSPKSAPVVPPAGAKGEFFPPPPQIVLGQSSGNEDKNGFRQESSTTKSKDQEEYFQQTRGSDQANHQDLASYQASQTLKDGRAPAAFVSPTHVGRNQDRAAFRLNQHQSQSKSQEISNYLSTVLAPSNSNEGRYERGAQYSQENTSQPTFMNLLSLPNSKNEEENNSYLNPMFQPRSNENSVDNKSTDRETNDSVSST